MRNPLEKTARRGEVRTFSLCARLVTYLTLSVVVHRTLSVPPSDLARRGDWGTAAKTSLIRCGQCERRRSAQ